MAEQLGRLEADELGDGVRGDSKRGECSRTLNQQPSVVRTLQVVEEQTRDATRRDFVRDAGARELGDELSGGAARVGGVRNGEHRHHCRNHIQPQHQLAAPCRRGAAATAGTCESLACLRLTRGVIDAEVGLEETDGALNRIRAHLALRTIEQPVRKCCCLAQHGRRQQAKN